MIRLACLLLLLPMEAFSARPAPSLMLATTSAKAPKIDSKLLEALRAELPAAARITVENVRFRGTLAPGDRLYVLSPHPPLGLVQFAVEGKPEASGSLGEGRRFGQASIRAYAPVAVAKLSLHPGDHLNRTNVRFEERELTPLSRTGFLSDWDEVLPLESSAFLQPGTVLDGANTRPPFLVAQGETVDLLFRQSDLTITAKVKALQNGNLSQWIPVQNPRSGKILQARVTGAGQVETR